MRKATVNQRSPANRLNESKTNRDKATTSAETTNISNESDEQSTSSPPQPYKAGNMKVNVPKTTKDTHVGPRSIILEEIRLEGISRSNIVNINDTCQNCERERKDKSFTGKLQKIKKNWTYGKCYLLAILIILIQILVLIFLYNTSTGNKQNEASSFDPRRISWMNNGLYNGFLRNNWTMFKDSHDCSYECPKLKSKIRFFNISTNMYTCFNGVFDVSACDGYLSSVMRGSEDGYVRDTYYNYFIHEIQKAILEGRSLTCPHDEPFLTEDNSEIITVGIAVGKNGTSVNDAESSLNLCDTISDLITNLRETKMLTKDYVLEFQNAWRNSFTLQRLKRVVPDIGRITFSEYGLHKNFDEVENPWEKARILAEKKYSRKNDTDLFGLLQREFPIIWNQYPDSNNSLITTEKFKCYFSVIYERRNLDFCKGSPVSDECNSVLRGYEKGRNSNFDNSVADYYFLSNIRKVIRFTRPNYSKILAKNKFFSVIILIHDSYNGSSVLDEETFVWFVNKVNLLIHDVEKRVNYSRSIIDSVCPFLSFECPK